MENSFWMHEHIGYLTSADAREEIKQRLAENSHRWPWNTALLTWWRYLCLFLFQPSGSQLNALFPLPATDIPLITGEAKEMRRLLSGVGCSRRTYD